jgi:uncharacterized DUF497 family protein
LYVRIGNHVLFEWDENKNRRNKAKHKVSFEAAVEAFDDPYTCTTRNRVVDGEDRWLTTGLVNGRGVLSVVHTWVEDERVRIISARKATPHERQAYDRAHRHEERT